MSVHAPAAEGLNSPSVDAASARSVRDSSGNGIFQAQNNRRSTSCRFSGPTPPRRAAHLTAPHVASPAGPRSRSVRNAPPVSIRLAATAVNAKSPRWFKRTGGFGRT